MFFWNRLLNKGTKSRLKSCYGFLLPNTAQFHFFLELPPLRLFIPLIFSGGIYNLLLSHQRYFLRELQALFIEKKHSPKAITYLEIRND